MRWTEEQLAEHNAKRAAAPSMADAPFHAPPDDRAAPITINVVGDPQGKGRARAFVRHGKVGHYTPEKTRTYEGIIRTAAMEAMGNRPPIDEPVEFVMRAVFAPPASWSEKKKAAALCGIIKPAKKPDIDNIAKAWNDALNGVVYRDDALIVKATFEKRYGPQALVAVVVRAA